MPGSSTCRVQESYDECMNCTLDSRGRHLRLVFGAPLFLIGLVLIILVYLQIIEPWGWITGAIAVIIGIGGVLSACYGNCMLQSVTKH
jgi:hypothetical protein